MVVSLSRWDKVPFNLEFCRNGSEVESKLIVHYLLPELGANLDFKTMDFRQHLELYRIGKGEQGVLLVEPYKSELLPHCSTSLAV